MYAGVEPDLSGSTFNVFENISGVWQLRTYEGGTLVESTSAPALAFFECDPADSVADGATLGFLVVLVWVLAWKFHAMRLAAR